MYRPRGSLARALYEKTHADEKLSEFIKTKWYEVTLDEIPPELRRSFLQLSLDAETEKFLLRSTDKSARIFTQLWHCFAKSVLSVFATQTSINGLLRRGSMFVFSSEQFKSLVSWTENFGGEGKRRLLDLGAGDGAVTSAMASLFEEVYATEVSDPMKVILAEKGFRILGVDEWASGDCKFDVISCLNLLDRCDRPRDILRDMQRALEPGGLVVVAIVLPFKPYVEVGRSDHSPSQKLDICGFTFEDQVLGVANVLHGSGYEIIAWTRLPYLCEGDLRQSYYWLDDAVFVIRPAQTPAQTGKTA